MNIRDAKPEDAEQISALMKELGYEASPELIRAKLLEFDKTSCDEVFVAEADGEVVGSISCHITRLFHQSGNSGRITSLVINKEKEAWAPVKLWSYKPRLILSQRTVLSQKLPVVTIVRKHMPFTSPVDTLEMSAGLSKYTEAKITTAIAHFM